MLKGASDVITAQCFPTCWFALSEAPVHQTASMKRYEAEGAMMSDLNITGQVCHMP
jgi:hypothetical protein